MPVKSSFSSISLFVCISSDGELEKERLKRLSESMQEFYTKKPEEEDDEDEEEEEQEAADSTAKQHEDEQENKPPPRRNPKRGVKQQKPEGWLVH